MARSKRRITSRFAFQAALVLGILMAVSIALDVATNQRWLVWVALIFGGAMTLALRDGVRLRKSGETT